jgi:hypothetical protein
MKTAPASVDPPRAPARRRGVGPSAVAIAVLALALAASLWHMIALEAYVAAGRPYDPTPDRLAAAELATTLEPWSQRFAWRAIALRGLTLFEAGKVDTAYFLVEPYSLAVHGTDATFLDVYHRILAVKGPLDSGKAHVAHGLDPLLNFGTTPTVPPTSTAASGTP